MESELYDDGEEVDNDSPYRVKITLDQLCFLLDPTGLNVALHLLNISHPHPVPHPFRASGSALLAFPRGPFLTIRKQARSMCTMCVLCLGV